MVGGRLALQPDGHQQPEPRRPGAPYLVVQRPPAEVEALLDRLMQHQPTTGKRRQDGKKRGLVQEALRSVGGQK